MLVPPLGTHITIWYLSLSSSGKLHPGGEWNDDVDLFWSSWLQSTSLNSGNLCPKSMLNSPLLKPLHEYARTLSLKLPQFRCSGRHCFGKDSTASSSPYLLWVILSSPDLWLGCVLAWHLQRDEPSFQVTSAGPCSFLTSRLWPTEAAQPKCRCWPQALLLTSSTSFSAINQSFLKSLKCFHFPFRTEPQMKYHWIDLKLFGLWI